MRPTAADTSSKLLPLAGCAANLNTAVYDFMTNSRYLRRTNMRTVHGRSSIRIHSSDASFEPCHFESSIRNFCITRMHHDIRMTLVQNHECIRMEFRLLLHEYQLLVINSFTAVSRFAAQPASGILAASVGCS